FAAGALGVGFLLMSVLLSVSTYRTPPEWRGLIPAAASVRRLVPEDAWIAAPEALIYAADRRGCRVEFTAPAARRAPGGGAATPMGLLPPRSSTARPTGSSPTASGARATSSTSPRARATGPTPLGWPCTNPSGAATT